jgi:hypothetical protein
MLHPKAYQLVAVLDNSLNRSNMLLPKQAFQWDLLLLMHPQIGHGLNVDCWGEGEDATLCSMTSPASLHQRRQDDWQTCPSSHASPDEGL